MTKEDVENLMYYTTDFPDGQLVPLCPHYSLKAFIDYYWDQYNSLHPIGEKYMDLPYEVHFHFRTNMNK